MSKLSAGRVLSCAASTRAADAQIRLQSMNRSHAATKENFVTGCVFGNIKEVLLISSSETTVLWMCVWCAEVQSSGEAVDEQN